MNIPYDEMPEKIEELMVEVERLESENKHLLDLQKSMDQQYEELEQENQQLKERVAELTNDWNEQIKLTNQENLDCSKYAIENQQLKDKLKLVESLASFNMSDNMPMVCMFKADYERNKYEYETLDKYKSVLDEIREVLNNQMDYREFVDIVNAIEEILDKVKE